jgi:hypothetical protein
MDVLDPHPAQFADAQAAGVYRFKDGDVAVRHRIFDWPAATSGRLKLPFAGSGGHRLKWSVQQAGELFDREKSRQPPFEFW